MGVVANLKELGGNRVYAAADSIPTIDVSGATSITIPTNDTLFYVASDGDTMTSMVGTLYTGRKVTLTNKTSDDTSFTGTAVASFPGTIGNMFLVGGTVTLSLGDSLTLRQLDTGAWVQIAFSDNS